ncbi:MAG: DUF3617 family protein [Gammaproteobacteria bacterium]|nr:DUF3617 family protein [Gammaproteobacteria bacterium]
MPNPSRMFRAAALGAGLLLTLPATAIEMTPGLWEMEMTSSNAFTGEQRQTSTQCIRESEFDPEMMRQDMEGCSDMDIEQSGNSFSWRFRCDSDDMKARGEGNVTIDGDTMVGDMRLVMDMAAMGGREFVVKNRWEGRRIGDC